MAHKDPSLTDFSIISLVLAGCPIEGETAGGSGFEDVTASDACCTCGGGGARSPTEVPGPTTAPSIEATFYGPNCTDFQDWQDEYQDGCDWYMVRSWP